MLITLWLCFGCVAKGLPVVPEGVTASPHSTEHAGMATGESGANEEEQTDRSWIYQPTVIHNFTVELSEAAQEQLTADPSTDVPAVFSFEDQSYDVGIHLRGNRTFRTLEGKPSLKIDFGEYIEGQTFSGTRRLTLNNMIQDGSMLRDEAAYFLFRAAGIPAPRHGYARIWINDEPYGLYGIAESIDEQFLADFFVSNDGNAYSGGYGGDLNPGCASLFELEEPGDGAIPPFDDLKALIDTVTNESDILDLVDASFDDTLLRFFAVEVVSGQRDGYVSYANNYMLYFDPIIRKWSMLPWGPDQSFSSGDTDVFSNWNSVLAVRCADDGDCRERVLSDVEDVLGIWEEVGLLEHMQTVQHAIADDCENDPRRELPCSEDQEDLLRYLADRPSNLRSGL